MEAKTACVRFGPAWLRVILMAGLALALLNGCAGAGAKTGYYVDDSAITAKVKSAFVTDKAVSALDIHVETQRGHVRLSGFAKSDLEKQKAAELARSVDGVTGVTNAISVGG